MIGCSAENPLRFPNGTILVSKTYELAIEDSSNILSMSNNKIKLNSFNDSLIVRTDTLWYNGTDNQIGEKVFGRIDQMVVNSRNREIKELYRYEINGVSLLGYITSDTAKPYIKYTPPLLIYPIINTVNETIDSKMITISSDGNAIGEGIRTQSILKRKINGSITINGQEEKCYLYELTLKQDAIAQYGEQGLIVPEAVVLSSNLLIGSNSSLIAEWGIRVRQKKEELTNRQNEKYKEAETYLELNIYKAINNREKRK